jgi:hypothetical protein
MMYQNCLYCDAAVVAVYRGVWEGSTVVAVKVVRCTSEDRFTRAVDEGRLSIGLCHPNVVQVSCKLYIYIHF